MDMTDDVQRFTTSPNTWDRYLELGELRARTQIVHDGAFFRIGQRDTCIETSYALMRAEVFSIA